MDCRAHRHRAAQALTMRPPFENPAAVLRQADAVLRALQPAMTAAFHAWGNAYRARFDYPGVIRVFDRNTGELVACSRPGKPSHLARAKRAAP